MKRVGRLIEQIADRGNLCLAYIKARRGKSATREAIEFAMCLEQNLTAIADALQSGEVRAGAFRRFRIYDPKERIITAPCFRDRVTHHALMNVCGPIFERKLIFDSYACRVGKGRDAAVVRAHEFSRRNLWFLKMDVRKYFDSIDHGILESQLSRWFKDPLVLRAFHAYVGNYSAEAEALVGLPIGSLTSQYFANAFLDPVDRLIKEQLGIRGYIRYMDDMVILGRSRQDLIAVRHAVSDFLKDHLRLDLKDDWHINRTSGGFDFLGARVFPNRVTLNRRSRILFSRRVRWLFKYWKLGILSERDFQTRLSAVVASSIRANIDSWQWRSRVLASLLEESH